MYVAPTGVYVSLSLTVDVTRVFFVFLDAVIAYVCLLIRWFRNKLIGWSMNLVKIDDGSASARCSEMTVLIVVTIPAA